MPSTLSVVVPYLSKSTCIETCRRMIEQNTTDKHEIIEVPDCPHVYKAYNAGAARATGKILVMLNDDMFVAPGWDVEIVKAMAPKTVVTTYLVESGRHPVNYRNIARDFGQSAEEFDYEGFVAFAEEHATGVPASRMGLGWYMPMAVLRKDFIPYPHEEAKWPSDTMLFGIFASRNYEFVQARSYAYHLQRMTA